MKGQTWALIFAMLVSGPIGGYVIRKHQKGQLSIIPFLGIFIILIAIVIGIVRYARLGIY